MRERNWHEVAVSFEHEDSTLIGIAAYPEVALPIGVLIVVGGPQYRAGSHRQFTLLARELAHAGFASFRFDYRGMGDSEGDVRNFESISGDIRAAIDEFLKRVHGICSIVIWGLCDAASAAMYYAHTDARVTGLILLNPWVHSVAGAARARLRSYYLTRLMQMSFWVKLLSGRVRLDESAGDLVRSTRDAAGAARPSDAENLAYDPRHGAPGYVDRMLDALVMFKGRIQLILSGKDLTAQEFLGLLATEHAWHRRVQKPDVARATIDPANHTFSSAEWRDQVTALNIAWLADQHP